MVRQLLHSLPSWFWTENVFCPTGKGGGIDATCGKGGQPATIKLESGILPLKSHANKAIKKMSKQEKGAIRDYTKSPDLAPGKSYEDINNAMRSCPPEFDCVQGEQREQMERIQSALDKADPLPAPVEVYRGLRFETEAEQDEMIAELLRFKYSNTTFTMPSFTSTSIDRASAESFAQDAFDPNNRNITMQITARSGLYVDSLSANKGEGELLQSPKARYRVRDVTRGDGPNGGDVVQLEEV